MPAKNKKNNNKNINKGEANAPPTTTEQPKELPVQLPAYQPIDFNATPAHLEVLHKKMRAIKKKLRRIEDAEKQEGKRNREQERLIAEKGNLTRALRDFEEIEKSLQKLDLTVPLRLWVGIFFAAAATGDGALNDLCTILLPPQNPPPSHSPLRELEHACQVAEHFLAGASAELFNDGTPVTFAQLKNKVVQFLSTPESELIVQPAAPASPFKQAPAPVEEKPVENSAAAPQAEAAPANFVKEEAPAAEESAPATQAPAATESRDLPAASTESTEKESAAAPETASETPADQQAPEEVKSESDGKDRKRGGRPRGSGRGRGGNYYNRNREDGGEGRGEGRGDYQHRNYNNKNRENGDYHHNNDGSGNYKPRGNNKPRGEGGRGGNKNYVRRGSPHTGNRNNSSQPQGETTQ